MKVLVLAVVLAVMQAAPPVPRKAADNNAKRAGEVNSKPNNQTDQAPKPSICPEQLKDADGNNAAHNIPRHDTEQTVPVAEAATVPEKGLWDKFYVVFTGLLVVAAFAGTWYAYRTLKILRKQTYAIRRQAVLMRRSTRATEKSIKMQEAQLMQWIDVSTVHTSTKTMQGRVPDGTRETPLFVNFEIDNPTSMIVTLNWVIIRIDGIRQKPQPFNLQLNPTTDPVTISTSIMLTGGKLDAYKLYRLHVPLIVYVGFTDAFNRPRQQHFACVCQCGPPASTNTSPYKGNIPDDGIQESEKNPN